MIFRFVYYDLPLRYDFSLFYAPLFFGFTPQQTDISNNPTKWQEEMRCFVVKIAEENISRLYTCCFTAISAQQHSLCAEKHPHPFHTAKIQFRLFPSKKNRSNRTIIRLFCYIFPSHWLYFPKKHLSARFSPSVALGQHPHHYNELPHNGLITDWGWCHHVTPPSLQWRYLFSNWAMNKKQGTFLQKYRTFLQKCRTFLQICQTFQMKCGLFFVHYGIFHQKCKTFCWTNPTIFLPKRFQCLRKTPFRCFFLIFSWKSCHKIWSIDENTINLPRKVCRIDY